MQKYATKHIEGRGGSELGGILPCWVTCFSRASRCSFSEAVAWCSQASMSPTYLRERQNTFKQCVTEGPTRGLILPHTDHGEIMAWVIVFQSTHTQTYTHGLWCYIMVGNSKVKLELLCVGLCVYDASVFVTEREDTGGWERTQCSQNCRCLL